MRPIYISRFHFILKPKKNAPRQILLTLSRYFFQARYTKLCYNEYNDCKTRRILENEASLSKLHVFKEDNAIINDSPLKRDHQGNMDDDKDAPKNKEKFDEQENVVTTRSRLIINPDYVSSLDNSDGSRQYDE